MKVLHILSVLRTAALSYSSDVPYVYHVVWST